MSATIYLLTLGFFLGTILVVFAMKYFSAAYAARARLRSDAAYRALAEGALAAEARTQARLAGIEAALAQLTAGLGTVQTILQQVE